MTTSQKLTQSGKSWSQPPSHLCLSTSVRKHRKRFQVQAHWVFRQAQLNVQIFQATLIVILLLRKLLCLLRAPPVQLSLLLFTTNLHYVACCNNITWYNIIWYNIIWYNIIWYNITWYNIIWYYISFAVRAWPNCVLFFSAFPFFIDGSCIDFA